MTYKEALRKIFTYLKYTDERRKNMKKKNYGLKITVFLLALFVILGCFVGCGDSTDAEPTKEPAVTAKPTQVPTAVPTKDPNATPEPTPIKYNDLTEGANVTIEANVIEDTFDPEYAIDDDESTRWSGIGTYTDEGDWRKLTIDLGAEYEIGMFYFMFQSFRNSYKIMYKTESDEEWQDLITRKAPVDLMDEFVVPKTKARYIMFTTESTGFCSIFELDIYEYNENMKVEEETQSDVNIALGKTATSDNRPENQTYLPEFAIDGDVLTRWAPMPGTADDTITWVLDLGQVYELDSISISFESCQSEFVIEICDTADGEYKIIEEGYPLDSVVEPYEITNIGQSARYIRYRRAGGAWGSFYEFCVYAK